MLICFFFNDTATTEIYTLSLHDALPIFERLHAGVLGVLVADVVAHRVDARQAQDGRPLGRTRPDHLHVVLVGQDRKSTRLNSSHANISYAVFCLKKKKYTLPYNSSVLNI